MQSVRLKRGVSEAVAQAPTPALKALLHTLYSEQAPWACEAFRRRVHADQDWMWSNVGHPTKRELRRRGEPNQHKYNNAATKRMVQEYFEGSPPPDIDLLTDPLRQPGGRGVAMYRSEEYAAIVRDKVASLTDREVMEMFYGAFAPDWHLLASQKISAKIEQYNTIDRDRGKMMFAVHYYALEERVHAIADDRRRELEAELRPGIVAAFEAQTALYVPDRPPQFKAAGVDAGAGSL